MVALRPDVFDRKLGTPRTKWEVSESGVVLAIALVMRVADFEDVGLTIANFRRCWNFSNKKPGQLSFQRLFPLLSAPIVQPVSGKSVEKSYHQVMRN